MWTIVLATALVAYNNVLSRWPPFNGPLYVPLNLVLALVLILVGLGPLNLSTQVIGSDTDLGDLLLGTAIGAGLSLPLFALRISDRRLAGLRGRALLYQTLVRVPLGTAVTEEIAFRGVLFAAASAEGFPEPAAIASLAFGLWHVGPTYILIHVNRPDASTRTKVLVIAAGIVATSVVGLMLIELRIETGGLVAPIALHASLNSLATLAAVRGST
jgi:uncharacterized protein